MTTSPTTQLQLETLGHVDGPLAIGGCDASELAARFGTPLYVHDAGVVRAQIARLRRAFEPAGADVLFAVKANPSVAVLRVAHAMGCGADVASAGELCIVATAGIPRGRVRMAGPAKSALDLEHALANDEPALDAIHVESTAEYARIVGLARERGLRPNVALRVNLGVAARDAGLRMAARSSPFGLDRAEVERLAARVIADGVCEFVGLHAHGGSQRRDVEAWLAEVEALLELAARVDASSIDFGGGFGWPVHAAEDGRPFDVEAAGQGLAARLAGHGTRRVLIEPGRYLCAPAGVYLTRVVDSKTSGGERQVVVDGGMHHCGAAAGFGEKARRSYPLVAAAAPRGASGADAVHVAGSLCTPADRFGRGLRLPPLAVGDVVAVLGVGAYGLSFSPTAFLSQPLPADVLVDDGDSMLVRERGRPDDALRGQRW